MKIEKWSRKKPNGSGGLSEHCPFGFDTLQNSDMAKASEEKDTEERKDLLNCHHFTFSRAISQKWKWFKC